MKREKKNEKIKWTNLTLALGLIACSMFGTIRNVKEVNAYAGEYSNYSLSVAQTFGWDNPEFEEIKVYTVSDNSVFELPSRYGETSSTKQVDYVFSISWIGDGWIVNGYPSHDNWIRDEYSVDLTVNYFPILAMSNTRSEVLVYDTELYVIISDEEPDKRFMLGLYIPTNVGYNDGYSDGYSVGYSNGYGNGYGEGIDKSIEDTGFISLFNAILSAPVTMFQGAFNFEIFGLNFSSLISLLLTIGCVVLVINIFTKGGK